MVTKPTTRRAIFFALALACASGARAAPRARRDAAVRRFKEAAHAAAAELDSSTGVVRRARWLSTAAVHGAPGDLARAFLGKFREALGLDGEAGELEERQTRDSLIGHHVTYRQTIGGLPVHDAYVGVEVDRDGRVRAVANDSVPGLVPATGPRIVDAARAVVLAERHVGVRGPLRGKVATEAVAFPLGKWARPAWRVWIPACSPLGDWEVVVDQLDGSVLQQRNRLQSVDGVGRVFNPNPVVALRDTTLRLATGVPAAAYSTVTLPGLDGSGFLRGPYADCFSQTVDTNGNPTGPLTRANQPNLQFVWDRTDSRFGETMAYYHIDSLQRFIQQTLGFTNVMNRPIKADAHAFSEDNSYFSSYPEGISLGDGGVPCSEDADIIRHEYGHAVQNDEVPGWGASHDTGSMGEGWADTLAVYSLSALGQNFNTPVVADWNATAYSNANPPALRRVDGTKVYPRDLAGEVHADGEIWSGALWQIRNNVGGAIAGDVLMLRLLIQSHFSVLPAGTFADGANALLAADIDLRDGADIQMMRQVFVTRGLLASGSPPIPAHAQPRRALTSQPADVVIVGAGFSGATQLTLGTTVTVPLTFTVVDDGHISTRVPPNLKPGSYAVNVTGPGGTGSGPARFLADDHPDTAAEVRLSDRISPGSPGRGNIGDGHDVDYFAFPALAGASYTIAATDAHNLDTVLAIYGTDGITQLAFNDDISSTNLNARVQGFKPPASGTYFAKVYGYDATAVGDFLVTVQGPSGCDLVAARFTGPAALTGGQPAAFTLDVENVGDVACGPFPVELDLVPASGASIPIYTTSVAGLPGRTGAVLGLTVPAVPESLAPGVYRLEASIDSTNAANELDLTNNTAALPAIGLSPPRPVRSFGTTVEPGLSLVAVPSEPFTTDGHAYNSADLASDLGASFVARVVTRSDGLGGFEVWLPGGPPAPFPIQGNQGYVVVTAGTASPGWTGMPWPDGSELVRLARGINLLAYPFGVPSGETASQLLSRTGGVYLIDVAGNQPPETRFVSYVSGGGGPALRPGRGYLVCVPRPAASAIALPRP